MRLRCATGNRARPGRLHQRPRNVDATWRRRRDRAVKAVFGDRARKLIFGSTKSMTGHLLGAAGASRRASCALVVQMGLIPPTINQFTPIPLRTSTRPQQGREATRGRALSNSFGSAGTRDARHPAGGVMGRKGPHSLPSRARSSAASGDARRCARAGSTPTICSPSDGSPDLGETAGATGDRVCFAANQTSPHQRVRAAQHLRILLLRAHATGGRRVHAEPRRSLRRGRRARTTPRASSTSWGGCIPSCGSPTTSTCSAASRRATRACTSRRSRGRDRTPRGIEQLSVTDVLIALQMRASRALPGGGAEVFSPPRAPPSPTKSSPARNGWRCIAQPTGSACRRTARCCTDHVETMADRVDHLLALRALQDETGGFLTYIPLAYHPDHTSWCEALGRTGTRRRASRPEEHRRGSPGARQHPAC